jgi:hypothetical protein
MNLIESLLKKSTILGAWCYGRDTNEMSSFALQFSYQKTWVKNHLPKVGENKIDELCKIMCSLMDAETEIGIEENYNTFKEDYGHMAVVMRYVDVGWACQNCYCKKMWSRFGRLLPHGFVDTTNLLERM